MERMLRFGSHVGAKAPSNPLRGDGIAISFQVATVFVVPLGTFFSAVQASIHIRLGMASPSNIQISENDICVLQALADFYVVSVPLLKRLCFPHHKHTRGTRNRVARLYQHGYLQKTQVQVAFGSGNAGPVYYPSKKGNRALASWFDDPRYLEVNTRRPRTDLLYHWLAISETHTIVRQAINRQELVKLDGWINEWEVVDKAANQSNQYYLHTQLNENPPLSCAPDAGFLLSVGAHKKVFYLEQDRATSDPKQVAARKVKGYAELYRRQLHRNHFPHTTLEKFTVLLVTVDAFQRDQIAKEVAKQTDFEPGLWLFVDLHDLQPETFLHQPITYNCQGEAAPLLQQPS